MTNYLIKNTKTNTYLTFCEMQHEWTDDKASATVFTPSMISKEISYDMDVYNLADHLDELAFIPA